LCAKCRDEEDRYWAESARAAINEAKANGEEPIPWNKAKKELDL